MGNFKLSWRLGLLIGFMLVILVVSGVLIYRLSVKDKTVSADVSSLPTPSAETSVLDKNFGLEIDKLSISVPIIKDVDGSDKDKYNKALKKGLAHYKGTALPGEKGNIFIFGHSSSDEAGPYGKVFAKLNDLGKGDLIRVYYQLKEYDYEVYEKKVVEATDLYVLDRGDKEKLTLMTCWPVGTKDKRLVVISYPKK